MARAQRHEPGRMRRRMEAVGVGLLGGVLLIVGVRVPAAGPLVGAGWVVLSLPAVIERWQSPLLGFASGLALFIYSTHLELLDFGTLIWLLLPIVTTVHYLVLPLVARLLTQWAGVPIWLGLPLAVGAAEWSRPLLGFGSYSMFGTGTFLFAWPVLVQGADVVGALGMSVLWTVPWAVGADLLGQRVDGNRHRSTLRVGLPVAAAVLMAMVGYGWWRLGQEQWKLPGPRVAVVQPNERHGPTRTPAVLRAQVALTRAHVAPGSADLVVWPENAILLPYESSAPAQQLVRQVVDAAKAPLLFGTLGFRGDDKRVTNTALLVGTDGGVSGRYDKVYLWPFTERQPLRTLGTIVPQLDRWVRTFTTAVWGMAPDGIAGEGPTTFTVQADERRFTFWVPICYEVGSAALARAAAHRGAQFFVNVTSEGALGVAVSANQLAASVLRGVENRAGVIRAGNVGISCFLSPDGRLDALLRGFRTGAVMREAGVLVHHVSVGPGGRTIYTRWGGAIDVVWPLLCLCLVAAGVERRMRSLELRPALAAPQLRSARMPPPTRAHRPRARRRR